jgi:hypothetical protein
MERPDVLGLRGAGVHWQLVEGEVLALDEATQEYLALNRSGALLWQMLARGSTRSELVQRLVSEYALEPARATADVDRLLVELGERGLLADPRPRPSTP